MSLAIPQAALVTMLQYITNNDSPEDLDIHLYQNDVTPTHSTVIGDLTEADFSGYASVGLTAGNWDFTPGSSSIGLYDTGIQFESDADAQDQDIYGYYITRRTTGDLMWAERFTDGPYNVNLTGDRVTVTPRILGVAVA